MCLAEHLTELSEMGVASLKIEGRMKAPEYVYGVTKIYRTLLDESRNAGEKEIAELSALFSRSGFTCGYYTGDIGRDMLGIRTADDKKKALSFWVRRFRKRRRKYRFRRIFAQAKGLP